MKNVKRPILAIIILSNVILFSVFLLALDYFYPKHFIGEAESALTADAAYMQGTESETDSYLLDNIFYFFPDEIEEETGDTAYSRRILTAENEIRDYYEQNDLSENICYEYRSKNGYYVFLISKDGDPENGGTLITYINVGPYLSFIRTLNWILLLFFIFETSIMSIIGWKLGTKIEKTQESQRIFFQNSSHELKTPLMSIQGYAEGIQTDVIDAKDASKVIISETEHMSKLVEELLSISKIDANQMTLHKIPMDIREVLYDCMTDLESFANMNHRTLIPEFSEAEAMVTCDEEQLERAIRNVLANAIRHANSEIHITYAIKNQKARIQIIDDGPGISDEEKPHVFERFYTGAGRQGGTGIGLSLASEIIRLHGGSMQVGDAEAIAGKSAKGNADGIDINASGTNVKASGANVKANGAVFEIWLPV